MFPCLDHVPRHLPGVVEATCIAVANDPLLAFSAAGAEALVPVPDPIGEVPREYEAELPLLAGIDLLNGADASYISFAILAGVDVVVGG